MDEGWEYRREVKAALVQEYGDPDVAIQRLGREGWELVGVENETASGQGGTGYGDTRTMAWTTTTVTYVFKRRRPLEDDRWRTKYESSAPITTAQRKMPSPLVWSPA